MKIQYVENSIKPDKQKWISVIVFDRGQIVATCNISNWGHDCPQIEGVSVQPKFRRHGFGTAMIEACIRYCESARKSSVGLRVKTDNKAAIKLYRRIGFRTYFVDGTHRWMAIPFKAD